MHASGREARGGVGTTVAPREINKEGEDAGWLQCRAEEGAVVDWCGRDGLRYKISRGKGRHGGVEGVQQGVLAERVKWRRRSPHRALVAGNRAHDGVLERRAAGSMQSEEGLHARR